MFATVPQSEILRLHVYRFHTTTGDYAVQAPTCGLAMAVVHRDVADPGDLLAVYRATESGWRQCGAEERPN